ncbi:Hypothetical protein CINCED_3A021933 [Cinara cedri]|uniref:Uncharacterized protein n=1 Tax=Cinara cedri TaxID=506608 RepID=A0A5E4M4F0_9HEMI|nr:Hypothetical protein CINCED_3A021933 [Cinara cedri]
MTCIRPRTLLLLSLVVIIFAPIRWITYTNAQNVSPPASAPDGTSTDAAAIKVGPAEMTATQPATLAKGNNGNNNAAAQQPSTPTSNFKRILSNSIEWFLEIKPVKIIWSMIMNTRDNLASLCKRIKTIKLVNSNSTPSSSSSNKPN